ncbi:MAG: peptidylprolyl isomerase [Gemmatimonadetes bacterium]|nr:peptidylprolyl isomerase [Gemmatimonadota bacterium]
MALGLAALAVGACAKPPPLTEPGDARFAAPAPDSFDVEFITTKGPFTVRVHRDWAPHGADRFWGLVQGHYFNGLAFFRVVRGFVAQFGLHADTAVIHAWEGRTIPDDTLKTSNLRGTLTFAHAGPGTRSTQMFFNLADNDRLDHLDGIGFVPFGGVVSGMAVLTQMESMYSGPGGREIGGPNQDSIQAQGDAYLLRSFPRLDRIEGVHVVRAWK